jgi:hypothetical protein
MRMRKQSNGQEQPAAACGPSPGAAASALVSDSC